MSRIGKKPVVVPDGVNIAINGRDVSADGPKGKLTQALPEGVEAEWQEAERQLVIRRLNDTKRARAFHGLARSLMQNMVDGCAKGFSRGLELHGIGYNIKVEGQNIVLQVGYNHPVKVAIPAGVTVTVEQATNPGKMTVASCDKQLVGLTAAKVRGVFPPEPYQGKGIRYADEQIRRKAGKAFASGGG